jgi:hypothetical protein
MFAMPIKYTEQASALAKLWLQEKCVLIMLVTLTRIHSSLLNVGGRGTVSAW